MQRQKSFQDDGKGILYLVPTPIGNLEDITFRALRILEEVELILAEDTRHTQKLLNHFDIKNELLSYHEHNQKERTEQIIEKLKRGESLALVSDAGMPAISDPGQDLVKHVIENNLRLSVLPGANAALNALVGSGLTTDEFIFYGFLPRKKQEKQAELTRLGKYGATIILYESPYRLKDTLQQIEKALGQCQVVIAREITKVYEEFLRGTAADLLSGLQGEEVKGECCIIIEGGTAVEATEDRLWWAHLTIKEHVEHYEEKENIAHKAALKKVAVDRNVSRREVYEAVHINKEM